MTKPSHEVSSITPESTLDMKGAFWRMRLGAALLSALWLMVFYQLSLVWTLNAQYSHGWLVPFLCLYLAFKSYSPTNEISLADTTRSPLALWLLGGISLLLIFPAWIIREANSDWRLINVVLVGLAMLITFAMLHHEGGWSKARALLFPILFFLVAVPWPLATDLQLTLWLQGKASVLIVDLLLLLGYQVELQGHVIHAPPFGHVGVDEACSGIHGLQASLVVSLFLGQYYRFSVFQRLLFCFTGLAFALLANIGRAFVLALYATRGKIHVVEEWHDAAGLIETGCILLGLVVCSQLIKDKNSSQTLSETNFDWGSLKTVPPLSFSIAGLSLILTTLGASHLHYYLSERDMTPIPPLEINFSSGEVVSEKNRPSEQIEAQLHYEEAQSAKWQDLRYARKISDGSFQINPSGEYWQGFACSWESGGACIAVLSTHSPDACLPLTGLHKIAPSHGQLPEITTIKVGDYEVPFESYIFEKDGNRLYVFRCFWPHKARGVLPPFPQGGYDFANRIKAAWRGQRNVGGTMIALCVGNVFDLETAKRKLADQIRLRITPKS